MQPSLRHRLSPIAGIGTLAIGLGFVVVLQFFWSLFSDGQSSFGPAVADAPVSILRPLESVTAVQGEEALSCYDPHILPVWHEMKKDFAFRERLQFSKGGGNCSEMLEVRKSDLNRDGNDEVLVRGKGPVGCGATGNCGYWIFDLRNGKARRLLTAIHEADAHEFGVDELQKSRSHGYPEILLTSRDGQHVLHFQTYRFNGIEYLPSGCMSEVPRLLRDGAGSWELITCAEFYSRRDEMRDALLHAPH